MINKQCVLGEIFKESFVKEAAGRISKMFLGAANRGVRFKNIKEVEVATKKLMKYFPDNRPISRDRLRAISEYVHTAIPKNHPISATQFVGTFRKAKNSAAHMPSYKYLRDITRVVPKKIKNIPRVQEKLKMLPGRIVGEEIVMGGPNMRQPSRSNYAIA
jgi:hypothetical protein